MLKKILIGILAFIVFIGTLYFIQHREDRVSMETYRKFKKLIDNDKWEKAYDMASSEVKKRDSVEEFRDYYELWRDDKGLELKSDAYVIGYINTKYVFVYGKGKKYNGIAVHMVKEDGEWKIGHKHEAYYEGG